MWDDCLPSCAIVKLNSSAGEGNSLVVRLQWGATSDWRASEAACRMRDGRT